MKIKKILPLCLLSSGLAANELDTLIDASGAISQQLETASLLIGAATMYGHTGIGLSTGIYLSKPTLAQSSLMLTTMLFRAWLTLSLMAMFRLSSRKLPTRRLSF